MRSIIVHPPGSLVTIFGGVKARIVSVGISAGDIDYKVAYWAGNSLHQEWIPENLIEECETKMTIGFKS